jgi:hypothetical protein
MAVAGSPTLASSGRDAGWPGLLELHRKNYIANAVEDAAAALQKLGGAKAILATGTEATSSVKGGLAVNGTLLVLRANRRPPTMTRFSPRRL